MAICCVSEKIQTAYLFNTLRALDFFAFLHLTIFEQAANFEFFGRQLGDRAVARLPRGTEHGSPPARGFVLSDFPPQRVLVTKKG